MGRQVRLNPVADRWASGDWRFVVCGNVCWLTRAKAPTAFGGSGLKRLRRLVRALPWEELGDRGLLVTLTYPKDWRRWVPDAAALVSHRRALVERWSRRWGERPFGLWVLEFQKRGAPHLHLYVRAPQTLDEEGWVVLRERTKRERIRDRQGRQVWGWKEPIGGEFGLWARTAWAEIVGTQGVVRGHHVAGVDAVTFFAEGYGWSVADGLAVGEYLAREIGKQEQKAAPVGFEGARMWGQWGGFLPKVRWQGAVPVEVAMQLEWQLVLWQRRQGLVCGRQHRAGSGLTCVMRADEAMVQLLQAEQRLGVADGAVYAGRLRDAGLL